MMQTFSVNRPGFLKTLKAYIAISKLRLVALLFFTGFASSLIASSIYGFDWKKIILVSASIILSVMGSNATTAYIDRDMDMVMSRTQKRPVPARTIFPSKNALIYGIVLVCLGVVLGAIINSLTALFIFLGFLDSAIIYNLITKKRSPLNIIFGAPAGGMPVLAGWVAVACGRIDLPAVFMFLIVIIWTPAHIWSLAYFFKQDYKKAGIPMLPVIWSRKKVFTLLAMLNFILVAFSIFIGLYSDLSFIYMGTVLAAGMAIFVLSIILVAKNSKKIAWALFKISSPYLAVIFTVLVVEYLWIK
ncbi:MAG: protoheme IX farnesyltransferase [Actinobacteria bacterium]|nr:protoheme IX farnesyltransferase [Actinomycetota bacterium]